MKRKSFYTWDKWILGAFMFGIILSSCHKSSSKTETNAAQTSDLATKPPRSPVKNTLLNKKSERVSPPDSVSKNIGSTRISVNYSQPAVKGRKVWGDLVPYSEVWRTGANEATVFACNQTIMIEGKTLKKGRYALFTIPEKDKWVIIFSKNPDQWGAFKYTESEDVLRVAVKPKTTTEHVERMRFRIDSEASATANLILEWEKLQVLVQIETT